LNADDNTIESPFQDLESLPQDVVSKLKTFLCYLVEKKTSLTSKIVLIKIKLF